MLQIIDESIYINKAFIGTLKLIGTNYHLDIADIILVEKIGIRTLSTPDRDSIVELLMKAVYD